jgi:hypothetical protein
MKLNEARDRLARDQLIRALEKEYGNAKAAARSLGVSREWIRRNCIRYGVDIDQYRKAATDWIVSYDGTEVLVVTASTEAAALAKAVNSLALSSEELGKLKARERK